MSLSAGTHLGPYEIVALVGAGGMGEIYKARDTRLDRTVAIKVLPAALASDPEFRDRFEREARAVAALNHPHICAIYDVGREPLRRPVLDTREDHSPSASGVGVPPSPGFGEPGRSESGGRGPHASNECLDFLVLEFLEGETLAARLERGPVPLAEALTLGMQIAGALDKAHRQGITHRDLKPTNVMLTFSRARGAPPPRAEDGLLERRLSSAANAKLLDFGLAKASGPTVAGATLSMLPTTPPDLTVKGSILGTFQYMAPEQIEGEDADARTDLFAFGVVLYEMLTGKKAFAGKTQASLFSAILRDEPPALSTLVPVAPPALDHIVTKCLAKDPDRRWQTARDLLTELEWIAEGGRDAGRAVAETTPAPTYTRTRVLVGAASVLLAGLTGAVGWVLKPLPPMPQPVRFTVPPVAPGIIAVSPFRDLALAPDGRHLVYVVGTLPNDAQLVVRALDQLDASPLRGLASPGWPFISPDSRWVGFFNVRQGALQKVSMTGGPAISLCRTSGLPLGASWGPDDTIVFATADPATGLLRVPAAGGGGEPSVLTTPDTAHGERDHVFPSVLPGGKAVLFTILSTGPIENAQVAVLDLKTGQRKTLIRGGGQAEYVDPSTGPGQGGFLVYAAAGILRAVRFDPVTLEVLSDPVPVSDQVVTKQSGVAEFSLSRSGALVHIPGRVGEVNDARRSLVWVTRQGREEPIKAPPRAYESLHISPDGTRIALASNDQEQDIWIWDVAHDLLNRLTLDPALDWYPVWTPDGRQIIFSSGKNGVPNLYRQASDNTGTVERLTTSTNAQVPFSISPDGAQLVFVELAQTTGQDVMLLRLEGQAQAEPLVKTKFGESYGVISPDGRWLAYESNQSGRNEIHVRPFPNVNGGHWQVSSTGGVKPVWAPSGRELFYLDPTRALMAVAVHATTTFTHGNPTKLFNAPYYQPAFRHVYDVSRDGQKFLMIKDAPSGDPASAPANLVVVLNWVEELKAKVPTRKP